MQQTPQIKVWDAPVRMFHGLLALSFAGAYLTAESERWRLVHTTLGYTVGGLVLFRLVWGLLGTRYARFGQFVRGPRSVLAYLQSLLRGQPTHFTGHNPAGAIAIVLMMALGLGQWATGWAIDNEVGGAWLESLHEVGGNAFLLVVMVHIAGVLVASVLHRANLPRAMVTGNKPGLADEGITQTWPALAALLLAAVLGFWAYGVYQWSQLPTAQADASAQAVSLSTDIRQDAEDD